MSHFLLNNIETFKTPNQGSHVIEEFAISLKI